ncbi:MAG: response regulator [Candidatus Sumerlaeaceae bacterium]|nr:response regulator [Candidatus Sumerlaeaceae bacterium]
METEGKGHILVVDDNDLNVEMLCMRLRRSGYEATGVFSGHQALAALEKEPYDLVVLDIMMPEMDGIEVLQEIRKRFTLSDLPVIMATAKAESTDMVKAFESGANDYVTKPIDLWVLLARIKTHLNLRRLAKEKDEFLAIASHDLKNPLNNIHGYAKLLLMIARPGDPVTEDMISMLGRIVQQSHLMLRIIVDFLDYHALQEGRLTLAREPKDLNQLVQECVEEHATAAAHKGLCLEFGVSSGPAVVLADADRIRQVLHNLFSNAIKFSTRGATIRARVERTPHGKVKFSIHDGGPGISDKDLQRVFEKFSRPGTRGTAGEKGSSIGLSIAKKFVEMHDGRIGCENHPNGGAVFWFELPAYEPAEKQSELTAQS